MIYLAYLRHQGVLCLRTILLAEALSIRSPPWEGCSRCFKALLLCQGLPKSANQCETHSEILESPGKSLKFCNSLNLSVCMEICSINICVFVLIWFNRFLKMSFSNFLQTCGFVQHITPKSNPNCQNHFSMLFKCSGFTWFHQLCASGKTSAASPPQSTSRLKRNQKARPHIASHRTRSSFKDYTTMPMNDSEVSTMCAGEHHVYRIYKCTGH